MTRHIAVFDQSTSLLFLFRSVLQELGYEVSTYVDLSPEVDMIEALNADLIILGNLAGYDEDEFDIVRGLRKHEQVGNVPIIICTTSPQPFLAFIQAENLARVEVLEKPFSFSRLRTAVTAALAD